MASGTYINDTNLNNTWGEANIDSWSNLDPDVTTRDDTRVQAAIDYAEALINDRFRGSRYVVPLAGTTAALRTVADIMSIYAGAWLYRARGIDDVDADGHPRDRVAARVADAERRLRAILAGSIRCDMARDTLAGPSAPRVVM